MSRNLIALQNKFLGHGLTVYDALSRLHERQGYISDEDILSLARQHTLPPQHVRSTAKFYENLSHDTPADHTIKLCNGEACRCAGYDDALQTLCARLGVKSPHSVSDKGVRLEHVTCLGLCGHGPNAMVDGVPVSLRARGAIEKVVAHVHGDAPLGIGEEANAIYMPADGAPCMLMRRFGKDTQSISRARAEGIYDSLEAALKQMTPEKVREEVKMSGLRGRGGAGFPTGVKFDAVARAASADGRRFVCVNADEGDAGTYQDKECMERDPHTQIEGALLAAYACGAQKIFFYIRFEYPNAHTIMRRAIDQAAGANLVGDLILGTDFSCAMQIVRGQGAYICGEETSLLRSIEGLPALVSFKPPYPAEKGLWGCPTAVNNVETLHALPWIIEYGGGAYARYGYEKSRGTKLVSLNSRVRRPGLYEVELGITIRQVIFDLAGGMADGHTLKAVQVGGPLGGIFPERLLDTPLDFEAMAEAQGLLGHGGIVVYSQADDLIKIGRWLMEFCAIESCGKCFPCRIGSVRGTELFDQMMESGATPERLSLMAELCETMEYGSLCALGGAIPTPIQCLMEYFPEEFDRYR